MSATKKANQSSPRLLDREGTLAGPRALSAFQSGNRTSRAGAAGRSHLGKSAAIACLLVGGPDYHRLLVRLVFGGKPQLIAAQVHDHDGTLAIVLEAQRRPLNGDLARADPQEPAELDDGRLHAALPVGQDVDDPAPILLDPGADLPAEDAVEPILADDRG